MGRIGRLCEEASERSGMELEHHKTISTKKEKQNETDKNRGIREELRKEVREERSRERRGKGGERLWGRNRRF